MYQGLITQKMQVKYANPVQYNLCIGDQKVLLNDLINKSIFLEWQGRVVCICGKESNQFYRQNFCYQCFWNAPQAAPSIFKPELCTADLGIEDRDLDWEKKFQLAPHLVYLSNTSGIKVGVTRKTNEINRWIDQGAMQAIVVAEVPNRRLAGLIEVDLKNQFADKTNWRKMLSSPSEKLNLVECKNRCVNYISDQFTQYVTDSNKVTEIFYPVTSYPDKIKSMRFEKQQNISGKLVGIKGQYMIFENDTVFNVRAHERYLITFSF
tara:strand:- start:670 stop:1464 length:795 start_codon:yes stop_codon:yes gene_type:complete